MKESESVELKKSLAEEPTVQFREVAQLFIAAFNRPSYDRSDKTTDKGTRPAQETPKKHQRNDHRGYPDTA
jgi:hypothetical protein